MQSSGVVTIITDAEIGEVRLNPLKSKHVKSKKNAAAIIRGKSLKSYFFLWQNQDSQNKSIAPLPVTK
jgi:hypothetical protein